MPLTETTLEEKYSGFMTYLDEWRMRLLPETIEKLLAQADGAEHVAVFAVDLTNGFCHKGQLHSDRVKNILPVVVTLLNRLHDAGVKHFILPQDCHAVNSLEFNEFPEHCVQNTTEAQTVPELTQLPFANLLTVLPKSTLSSAIGTGLDDWLQAHPEVTHRVVVGDCTDLCVYQLAMHLKLTANAANRLLPVIVPYDGVATYDLPEDLARDLSVYAHPGDLFQALFLYHLALNGVRVVDSLT